VRGATFGAVWSRLVTGIVLLAGALTVGVWNAPGAAADASPAPATSRQLITVNAPSSSSTTATLTAWQRGTDGVWRVAISPVGAHVGGAGIGAASEGSERTPAGTFSLTQAFGRQADPGTRMPYFRTDPLDWWDENPASPTYNLHVRRASSPGAASENLYYSGSVYDYVVNMNYNTARVPGAGSAFFLHVSDGTPTAGCVSVPQATMVTILRWLDPAQHPYISIKVGSAWKPPAPPTGVVDTAASTAPQRITVGGWAFDPASPAKAKVKITVSGPAGSATTLATTGIARPDVARKYSWAGPATGYRVAATGAGVGTNRVCVSVVSVVGTRPLGCRTVVIRNPFGRLDAVSANCSIVTVAGWALNPNNPSSHVPIQIRDSGPVPQVLSGFRAAADRPDIARAYPGYGPAHGYRITVVTQAKGTHTICAIAVPEFGGWSRTTLGCKSILIK
jgi:L,D-peptidoglycan transpeptidase YkuD (ErfK/YbiS/YcfS/YnhG family)